VIFFIFEKFHHHRFTKISSPPVSLITATSFKTGGDGCLELAVMTIFL
jgi:hypothetical protein